MRCGYADDAKLLPGAALLRVHVRSEPLELAAFDDKGKACTPGNEGCMTGCTSEHWTESDQFYDLEALVRVASVVEAGKQGPGGKHTQVVACASDATGKIGITGGGCNQLIKTGAGDANPNACAAPADKDAFKCVQGKTCPKGWHGDAGLTCRRICAKSADCKELGHVCSNAFGGDDLLCDVKEVKPTR